MTDSGTELDIDSMTSIIILLKLLISLSLLISVSSSLPQKVISSGHSTINKSEIENLTIDDAAIPTIDSKTLDNTGNNLSSQGKFKLALTFYDRALAISRSSVKLLIDKADVLSKLSRYEDAINKYNKALALQPSNLTILFDKANLLPYLGKYEDAISVYDTILTLNPHSSNAMGRKGLNLYDLERLEEPFPILIRF